MHGKKRVRLECLEKLSGARRMGRDGWGLGTGGSWNGG